VGGDERPVDLAVIGGGITGAAVARDASLRGLSVALYEKGDFSSGTTSKTSRLIHGGLRYLEGWDFTSGSCTSPSGKETGSPPAFPT
jgi:glycerol-3-phosphate dehydrogenase